MGIQQTCQNMGSQVLKNISISYIRQGDIPGSYQDDAVTIGMVD